MSPTRCVGLYLLVLLGLGCGDGARAPRSAERRQEIIGGITDRAHWYAVMVGDDSGGFCSGTLISKRTVITAAHCWEPGQEAITRVFFDLGTRQTVGAVASLRHPGYDDWSMSFDLGIVQLASDAPVQAAPLLRQQLDQSFIGPSFTWVGYGDSNRFGDGFGTRRVVTFPINLIGPVASIPAGPNAPWDAIDAIDDSQFYFQVDGKNTCTGDSGGPGFVIRDGVERHAGVTSYGDERCSYDGAVARTDTVTMGWIQQHIDTFEPNNPCKGDGTCNAACVSTNPAPLGTLDDPDCADQHCAADEVCVLSCSPVDADCASLGIDACGSDGICQNGCATADADCGGTGGGGAGGGAGGGSGGGISGGEIRLPADDGALGPPPPGCGCTSGAEPLLALGVCVLLWRRPGLRRTVARG